MYNHTLVISDTQGKETWQIANMATAPQSAGYKVVPWSITIFMDYKSAKF